jgi:UDP-N-acetylglucosamine 2-epimerase (non-hydrolysing)
MPLPLLLIVIGTRPEAIKLAPVIRAARDRGRFDIVVCTTGQHREMVSPVLDFFGVRVDHDLGVMRPNQGLSALSAAVVETCGRLLEQVSPDAVVVQGDTTSAFAASLAAFHAGIPVAHVEAGLRSHDLASPFPEEGNRTLIGRLARWHFAPTQRAADNLAREGIVTGVVVVGNTVIDALLSALPVARSHDAAYSAELPFLDRRKRMVLVTGHRRESFGEPFRAMCMAIRTLGDEPDIQVVYPVHLNPNVRAPVEATLRNHSAIHLIEPVDYPRMVWLLDRCHLVLTDSGGIQEEAPSLGRPVLVMRDVTERVEVIDVGCAVLVGTSTEKIVATARAILGDPSRHAAMARCQNPYGDGTSAIRILDVLSRDLGA